MRLFALSLFFRGVIFLMMCQRKRMSEERFFVYAERLRSVERCFFTNKVHLHFMSRPHFGC